MTTKYLIPFLLSFLLSVFFLFIAIYLAEKINWAGRNSERHIHSKRNEKIFRVGGLAMILAFNLAILLNRNLFISTELYAVMLATILLAIIGTIDDFREIAWKIQLFFQVALALMVFIIGVRIYYVTNPLSGGIIDLSSGAAILFSAVLVIIWITVATNAMNWLDGVDGLSGGVGLIGALTIFFLSLKPEVNQPPVAIISAILSGSILGFLIFNYNPSKVLAGTAGSMFMGFILAALAIFSGTKIATAILVLTLPLIDFLWVIGERIRNKKSIFKADRNHLHHKLLELGWSQRKINAIFFAVTALLSAVALNTRAIGKSVTFFLALFIMVVTLIILNKKIKKLSPQK
jgi:UDP-GlcNAc:undecaprenyl-phosphate GlcNAc-1-phosphate transferase